MRASALALALVLPVPVTAGGSEGPAAYARAVPDCAALAASDRLTPGAVCVQDGRVIAIRRDAKRRVFHGLLRDRPRVGYVRGRRCPYPTRPSDSPFSGGAAYIIKNDVRAEIGCVFYSPRH